MKDKRRLDLVKKLEKAWIAERDIMGEYLIACNLANDATSKKHTVQDKVTKAREEITKVMDILREEALGEEHDPWDTAATSQEVS